MKERQRIKWLVILFLGVVFLGSSPATIHGQTNSLPAIEVIDSRGKSLRVQETINDLVAILPSDVEILYELGAGDKITGRGEYANYPQEVEKIPIVSSEGIINVEEIIHLDPDLILIGQMAASEETVNKLEQVGIPVFVSDAQSIEDIYTTIEALGLLVGEELAATQLVEKMQATFDEYASKAEEQIGPSVYFEVSPLEFGLYTAGEGTFMDELAKVLHAKNIFAHERGWPEISQEQVIQRSPEVIVSTDTQPDAVKEISQRKGWEKIPAVESQRIYQVDTDVFSRPGPRLMEAVQELYDILYGPADS